MFAQLLQKYSPDQARVPAGSPEGGQFTAGDSASGGEKKWKTYELFKRLSAKDGGFTYQPVTGVEPTRGFALSTYPQRSWAKPASEMRLTDLIGYVAKNRDLFERKNHFLGAWHDPETDKVFLDISVVTEDRKKAERLARKYDQIAYFDIGQGKSVTVDRNATSGGAAKGDDDEPEATDAARAAWIESYLAGGPEEALQEPDGARADGAGSEGGGGDAREAQGFLHVLKYSPDQPRAPAGTATGGQWIAGQQDTTAQTLDAQLHKDRALEEVLSANLTADERKVYDQHLRMNEGPTSRQQNSVAGTNRLTAQRLAVHRQILDTFFKDADRFKPPAGQKPEVVILAGRGGSGKTNFADQFVEGGVTTQGLGAYTRDNHLVIDTDHFKDLLAQADKNAQAYGGVGPLAPHYHDESGLLFDKAAARARREGLNVVFDVTLNSQHLSRLNAFKKAGYTTSAYLMYLPSNIAADRAMQRYKSGGQTGRFVPPQYVLSSRNNEKNFDAMKSKVDRWAIYRNDVPRGERPKYVAGTNLDERRAFIGKSEGFASVLKAGTSEGAYKAWETIKAKYPEKFEKAKAAQALGVKVGDVVPHVGIGDSKGWKVKDGHAKAGTFIASSVLSGKAVLPSQTAPKPAPVVAPHVNKPVVDAPAKQLDLIPGGKQVAPYPRVFDADGIMRNPDLYRQLNNHTNDLWETLPDNTKKAVRYYTSNGYKDINRALARNEGTNSTTQIYIQRLDALMHNSTIPIDVTVHRAMAVGNLMSAFPDLKDVRFSGNEKSNENIYKSLIGRTYNEKAFVSTTLKQQFHMAYSNAAEDTGKIGLNIRVPKGSAGFYTGIHSDHAAEEEIILPRNSKFLITGRSGSTLNVDLLPEN